MTFRAWLLRKSVVASYPCTGDFPPSDYLNRQNLASSRSEPNKLALSMLALSMSALSMSALSRLVPSKCELLSLAEQVLNKHELMSLAEQVLNKHELLSLPDSLAQSKSESLNPASNNFVLVAGKFG